MKIDDILNKIVVLYKGELCRVDAENYDKQKHELILIPINTKRNHTIKIVDTEDRKEITEPTSQDLQVFYTIAISDGVGYMCKALTIMANMMGRGLEAKEPKREEEKLVISTGDKKL